MRSLAVLLLLFVLLTSAALAAELPDSQGPGQHKIGAGVAEAVAEDGQAEVVIALAATADTMDVQALDLATLQRQVTAQQEQVLSSLTTAEFQTRIRYQAVPALVGRVFSASALAKLAADPAVLKVDLDAGAGAGHLADSVPLINADDWHTAGFHGQSVLVAVLDTGMETTHDDLKDDVGDQACFLDTNYAIDGVGNCPNGSDRQFGAGAAEDDAGHGTHTSGIITSKGTKSSVGVAPGAEIVSVKVLDDCGYAGCFYTFTEITAALDYLITDQPDVKVINMSLGTFGLFAGDCDNNASWLMAGAAAINTLRARGTIAFASAGNESSISGMGAPACLSNVVAVGATNDSDEVASFSNSTSNTDIMAPGVGIVSLGRGNTTYIASGTSMASPHAAGCAVLLMEGGLRTPDQVETWLKASDVQVTDPKNGLTYPRINCAPFDWQPVSYLPAVIRE